MNSSTYSLPVFLDVLKLCDKSIFQRVPITSDQFLFVEIILSYNVSICPDELAPLSSGSISIVQRLSDGGANENF